MGLYNNTYVGVYILVKPKKVQLEKTREVFISATGKKHDKEINFDPEDGSPVTKQKESYFEEFTFDDWPQIIWNFDGKDEKIKGLDDDLICKINDLRINDYVVWLYNRRSESGKHIEEHSILDLSSINVEEKINSFKKEIGDSLERIKNYVEDIKICYGVINYLS